MLSTDVANCVFTSQGISNLRNLKNIAIPPLSFSIVKELNILHIKPQNRKRDASCAGTTLSCSHFLRFFLQVRTAPQCGVPSLPKGSTWVVTSVGKTGETWV